MSKCLWTCNVIKKNNIFNSSFTTFLLQTELHFMIIKTRAWIYWHIKKNNSQTKPNKISILCVQTGHGRNNNWVSASLLRVGWFFFETKLLLYFGVKLLTFLSLSSNILWWEVGLFMGIELKWSSHFFINILCEVFMCRQLVGFVHQSWLAYDILYRYTFLYLFNVCNLAMCFVNNWLVNQVLWVLYN